MDQTLLLTGEEDPIFFAEYFLGVFLNPFQKRALLSLCKRKPNFLDRFIKQILWVTGNQVGKTVALSISHIWFDFYKKGFSGDPVLIEQARYETLNISPVSRQATEALRYVEEILHSNFSWEFEGKRYINKCKIGWFWQGKNENLGRIDFANNSSFWCLSTGADQASGLAGKQFGYISYDECVQSHHLEDELGARIFSRTAKYSGWIVLVSTPDELGKSQQYWYHLYTTAKREQKEGILGEYYLIEGLYDENIFIPEEKRVEFKERLKKNFPQKYLQVVKGMFLDSVDRMFSLKVVEGMWNDKKAPTEAVVGNEYVVIIDWGVADSGDETVIGVGDITDVKNIELVHAWSKQGGDPVELMAMATYLIMTFNDAPLVMDVTEMGGTIFKKMMRQFKPIAFGQGNKPDALFFLQLMLRNNIRGKQDLTSAGKSATGKLKSYYLPKLEKQLSSYKLDDKKIKQDWVMMLVMLAWYVEKYKKASQIKSFNLNKFYNR